MNSSISLNLNNILKTALRFTGLATALVIIGLLGFTAYQISQITSAQADASYLHEKQAAGTVVKLKLDAATSQQLQQRRSAGADAPATQNGKNDPFAL